MENIFKAYDIRGEYPKEINDELAFLIGRAFVQFAKAKQIIVAQDNRFSSASLTENLIKGINEQGADVIDINSVSVDVMYYASGKLNCPGIMVTASHLPKEYNGFKFSNPGAEPINQETGLEKIKSLVKENSFKEADKKGEIIKKDILDEYIEHTLGFINKESLSDLKIVADAGNGMAGKMIPLIFKDLPLKIIPLNFETDGSFPGRSSNPIIAENIVDLKNRILEEEADLGIAFDTDADRAFFMDEQGSLINSSLIISLISREILKKKQNERIVYSLICSKVVPETIKENKGIPVISRVGHSFVKQEMRKNNAIFGGERSGHYYFRDNFYADSPFITVFKVLEIISKGKNKFSEIVREFDKYFKIEQVDFKVKNQQEILEKLEEKYKDGKISHLDGLTIEYSDWWFNLRASNTEPVMRLNLEAEKEELMEEKTKEVSRLIQS